VTQRRVLGALWLAVLVASGILAFEVHHVAQPGQIRLPLRPLARVTLPGTASRFDYASIDPGAHLLFIAHLGDSEMLTVDTTTNRVVRRTPGISQIHGVLVVPSLHRVYASATGTNELVALDEGTGAELWRTRTDSYPDGIAYAATTRQLWVSNEDAGSETVADAVTGRHIGSVRLGGEVGNVAFDPGPAGKSGAVLVDVQSSNELVSIDPVTRVVEHRQALSGCDHDHGLAVLPAPRLAFIACDGNATLLVLDLTSGALLQHFQIGSEPDVLATDPTRGSLLIGAESGTVSVLRIHGAITLTGRAPLAAGAHVVAIDTSTGNAYWPLADANGHPQLLVTTTPVP